ncbi:hypothetical protein EJ05DRAFT_472164 [Pseudovirgaria hyperparasitica]|uniref:GPI anchored protein n=1 Tax=Pseudovirgaria hyperparasitica TaxID=470096 RepID=A0A6A6WMK0_9PEZI|nr:uncharacterized protein EJ05DRAFT_472164 [Pseudovirgaria hyperparasitica]KAF2763249.1 hypothetical protein EJ05DRAFT_472164 [Pseudovirgaria hyperparasitica]
MLLSALYIAFIAFATSAYAGNYAGDFNALIEFAPLAVDSSSNASNVEQAKSNDYGMDMFAAMKSRRQSCSAGYGICYETGRCCPDPDGQGGCCDGSGVCITAGDTCCAAGHACQAGRDCCGDGCVTEGSQCCQGTTVYVCTSDEECCSDSCMPIGSQCCDNGQYCESGNSCYSFDDDPSDIFCCTNEACTAYVEGGVTTTRTTSQAPPQSTRLPSTEEYQYYYIVYTWYYYAYYYTLVQRTSVVTYTYTTTTTTLSIYATNSQEASSIGESQIETITRIPPEDASTELASLVETAPPSVSQTANIIAGTIAPGGTRSVAATTTGTGPEETEGASAGARIQAGLPLVAINAMVALWIYM